MKTPTFNERLSLEKRLKSKATNSYFRILYRLCQDYPQVEVARAVSALVRARDIRGLVDLADSISSTVYEDATSHFVANQFASIIKKYPFPEAEKLFDPKGTAVKKFLTSEHNCLRVNQKFRASRHCGREHFSYYKNEMRKFISYVLGDEPSLADVYDNCGFGPGASIGVHGDATNLSRKLLNSAWSVTPTALHYAYGAVMRHAQFREILLSEHGGFSSGSPDLDFFRFLNRITLVQHNKIEFVPKTVKTHRSIAVEPLLNGYLQKGIDVVMRMKLKRIGIDLSDQSGNQRMARDGSYDDVGAFATIDLRSASDSIATEVVRDLLPPAWFALLDATRSKSYIHEGKITSFQKFVSMGNGFCFPLETLLFVAACHAVGAGRPGRDFRVYGDDIIVRRQHFVPTLILLGHLGFKSNPDKTFCEGPFRESCGADWFGGKDVRPFTLDFALDSVQNVFKFLNLTRRNERTAMFFEGVRDLILDLLPSNWHLYRPYKGNADTGIDCVGDEFLAASSCRYDVRKRQWRWLELDAVPIADHRYKLHEQGNLALVFGALLGVSSSRPFTFRNRFRTKVRQVSHCGASSTWLPPLG